MIYYAYYELGITSMILLITRSDQIRSDHIRNPQIRLLRAGMGIKLEFSINPLAKSNSFTVHCMDEFRTKGVTVMKQSSENSIDRSRMLEREETNKYNKESIKRTMQMHEYVFQQQVRELHRLYSVQRVLMNELRRTMKFTFSSDMEVIEDQFREGTCTRRRQMNLDQDSEVELTLSIGSSSSSSKKREKRELDSSLTFKSETGSHTNTLDEETKRSHWIFKGLRIDRT